MFSQDSKDDKKTSVSSDDKNLNEEERLMKIVLDEIKGLSKENWVSFKSICFDKMPNFKKIYNEDEEMQAFLSAYDNKPSDLNNITWCNNQIEMFDTFKPGTIDIAYANYVMHWVINKEKAVSIIANALKPGGLYIMNCITEYSDIIADIAKFSEEYNPVFKKYNLVNKDNWISLLHSYKFDVIETQKIDDFIFDCLDDFLAFWEATSHGKFQKKMLSDDGYDFLLKKYPNEIAVFGHETFNAIAIKRIK